MLVQIFSEREGEAASTKHTPKFRVVMDVSRVEIVSNGALKQGRILWNNRETASQIEQANGRDIQSIDATFPSTNGQKKRRVISDLT